MGYYVRSLPWKKSDPRWKVQFVSYKSKDTKDSNTIKAKKEWDVDPDRWRTLGFHKLMTLEEARVRARQLNAQDFVKRQEERIQRIAIEENNNKKNTMRFSPLSLLKSLNSDYCEVGMLKQERGEEKLLMLGQNGKPLRK